MKYTWNAKQPEKTNGGSPKQPFVAQGLVV